MAQKKNDRVILHCDMNGFYASVELLTHPELRDRPMAVSGDPDNRHGIILAKNQLAKEKGCDETVLHRGDIVTECAHSNIHILKDGKFITHPADEYILPGIARAHLIEACRALNIPVEERAFTLDELFVADEVIVSSSGDLCNSAYELDGRAIGEKDEATLGKIQQYIVETWLEA